MVRIFAHDLAIIHELVMIYHMLAEHVPYTELGESYFDEHDRQATEKRLVRRLEKLGYQTDCDDLCRRP
jgi:transposase